MFETYTAQVLPLVCAFLFGACVGGTIINMLHITTCEKTNLCHDCGADIDETHTDGCDVERCSVCGGQRLQCDCEGHDKHASRWTGEFPYE